MTFNFTSYNADFVGIKCIAKGNFYSAFEFRTDLGNFIVQYYNWTGGSIAFGVSTGFYDPAQNAYELISNWNIDGQQTNRAVYYPDKNANITIDRTETSNTTASKAQGSINELIQNNAIIYCNNILGSAIINRAQERNINIPKDKIKELVDLQIRLENRNLAITKAIRNTNYSTFEDAYADQIRKMWNNNYASIGVVISTTVAIISSIVVVSMLAGIIILLYERYHPESKVDLKYSDDLTRKLIQYLPPDVYAQLIKENKLFEDTANRAIKNQKGLGTLKTIGIAAAVLFGVPLLINYYKKHS